MRSDRDNRTDSEREIDEFLSSFETPVDELSADINSYLDEKDTTKMTAARTFYGVKYSSKPEEPAESIEETDSAAEGPASDEQP